MRSRVRQAVGITLAWTSALAAGDANAQPTVRKLSAPADPEVSFKDIAATHAGRVVGKRLPEMEDGLQLQPAVIVTIGARHASVWDKPAVTLPGGSFPRASLALCPELCAPALRDAAAAAILEHAELIKTANLEIEPRFLVIADAEIALQTLLIALRSLTAATGGAPAGMDLLVKTPFGLRSYPIHILPPDAIPIRPVANPLLLELEMSPKGWTARAMPFYLQRAFVLPDPERLLVTIGQLHSRDPNRKTVFLAAPGNTAIRVMAKATDLVRQMYPVVVWKLPGPLKTRVVERPR